LRCREEEELSHRDTEGTEIGKHRERKTRMRFSLCFPTSVPSVSLWLNSKPYSFANTAYNANPVTQTAAVPAAKAIVEF